MTYVTRNFAGFGIHLDDAATASKSIRAAIPPFTIPMAQEQEANHADHVLLGVGPGPAPLH